MPIVKADWVIEPNVIKNNGGVVLIFPGMAGGSNCNYITHLATDLMKAGFHVGIYNNEGINETPILNQQIASFSSTSSLTQAIHFSHSKFPDKNMFIVGVSMGASRATRCLAKMKDSETYIKGFISVSNPFDLGATAHTLSQRRKNYLYNYFFMRSYLKYFKQHCHLLESKTKEKGIDLSKNPNIMFQSFFVFEPQNRSLNPKT